jgi:DNA polymerase III subunit gamma/tau
MLGTVDREHAVRLVEAVAAGDGPRILAEMATLDERVPNYDDVLGTFAALLQRAAVLQAAPDLDDDEDGLTARARPIANVATPEDLQLWYQMAVAGRRDLPLAPSPRAGCEMVLLRMLAFRFASPAGGLEAQAPAAEPGRRNAPRAVQAQRPGRAAPQAAAAAVEPPPAPAESTPARSDRPDDWEAMIDRMDLAGATRQLARHCGYLGRDGGLVKLRLDPVHEVLATSAQQERLRAALELLFGEPVRLQIDWGRPPAETPAERERRAAEERQQQAEVAIDQDPVVRELQQVFDAKVDRDSIRPAD